MTMAAKMDVENLIYWISLIPLSALGITSNLVFILVWSAKRYTFSRLILKTMAAADIFYLCFFHVWQNLRGWGIYYEITSNILFGFRHVIVTLYFFLSITQYFYYKNLTFFQLNPQLVQRKRVVIGLVLVVLWCVIIRLLMTYLTARVDEKQKRIPNAAFSVLNLVFPQILLTCFVIGMIIHVRRQSALAGTLASVERLEAVALKCVIGQAENCDQGVSEKRLEALILPIKGHIKRTVSRLSNSSGALSHTLSSSSSAHSNDSTWGVTSVSARVLARLQKNCMLETNLTKAIIAICIPSIFVYLIGVGTFSFYELLFHEPEPLFSSVLDILQFLHFSSLFYIMLAMYPPFKRLCATELVGKLQRRRKITLSLSEKTDSSGQKSISYFSRTRARGESLGN